MGYEWRDLTGLEKPEQLEPCWRCDHPPLEIAVAKLDANDRKHLPGAFRGDLPAAHICICSHCGFSVPAPNDEGYSSPALAALRWNGEMLGKRMKQAEAKREFVMAGGKPKQFKFGTQLRSRTTAGASGVTDEHSLPETCGNCGSDRLRVPTRPRFEPGEVLADCDACGAEGVLLESDETEWRGEKN